MGEDEKFLIEYTVGSSKNNVFSASISAKSAEHALYKLETQYYTREKHRLTTEGLSEAEASEEICGSEYDIRILKLNLGS